MKPTFFLVAAYACLLGAASAAEPAAKPNIVYILCDDLGYGDVQRLGGPRSKIPTPHMDSLAAGGMTFTEAHSSSAVCTPTRYGILTGRYNWRSTLQKGVLLGYGPPLIAADRLTVPGFLRKHGYATACVGKWHLGMELSEKDLDRPILQGPTTRGFDAYFGISASLDMPPFAYIDGDRFTEAPTATKKWVRSGAAAPGFEAVDVLPTLARKADETIALHAAAKKPFFLYLPLTSPHTPIEPTAEWKGKSGLGPYADFVMATDAAVGEVLAALEKHGVAKDTMVILTSDNGCSPHGAPIPELEKQGHFPSELRRGAKADVWDGGHRVPFLVRWPGRVAADSRSSALVCLTDLMATCAELLGEKLPDDAGEDSESFLPTLLGKADAPSRETIVHHSIEGAFAIRQGKWKLCLCRGSGGWSKGGGDAPVQLYDVSADVGERENLAETQPEVVARLTALLEKYVADGRSTPGAPQKNDAPIVIRKPPRTGKRS